MDALHWLALVAGLVITVTGASMAGIAPLRVDRLIGLLTLAFGAYLILQAMR